MKVKKRPRTRLSVHIITSSVWNNYDFGDKEDVDLESDELLVDEEVVDLPDVDAQLHLEWYSSFTIIMTIMEMLKKNMFNYHD